MRKALTIAGEFLTVVAILAFCFGGVAIFGDHVTSDIALEEMK